MRMIQEVLREITARRKGSDTIESFGTVNHFIMELARWTCSRSATGATPAKLVSKGSRCVECSVRL